MFDRLIIWLASLWAVDDSKRLPAQVDLIALVSIGSKPKDLTNGARSTILRAASLLRKYNRLTPVVFGAFSGNGNHDFEELVKTEFFYWDGCVCVGKVLSTITECLAFKAAFPDATSVVFVTEQAHSRRAKIIWNCLWSEAKIYIVSVPIESTVDAESPMAPYRKLWTILAFQALPTPIYWVASLFGPKHLQKLGGMHQPITS